MLSKILSSAKFFLFVIVLGLQVVSVSLAAVDPIVTISNAELKNNTLVLKHDSLGSINFKKRIYDIPPRLVFDILNAKTDGKTTQSFNVNHSEIREIRVGQFDENVVRVVVESTDISSLEKIKIDNIGQAIYFQLGIENVTIESHSVDAGDLLVTGNGPIAIRTIELDRPERLVVDLIGAQLKNSSLKQNYNNGEEEIRIAQFDRSTVRIVFTGIKSHKRSLEISKNKKQLLIRGKDLSEKKDEKNEKGKITGLRLIGKSNEESIFTIKSGKKLDYKFLKLLNPDRLVVDLYGFTFDDSLTTKQFEETNHVKDVRFGIATLGRPVTRIVFDLKQENLIEDFAESVDGTELTIKISSIAPSKTKDGMELPKAEKSIGRKVVIDAGHGGYDPGTMHGDHSEKDITLSITKKVKILLEEAGIKTYLTRTEDRFISLAERVEISNNIKPRAFVSIHVNALVTNPGMDGLQTYYYSPAGYQLASVIHQQLINDVRMPDRNKRKARFWVCKYSDAPAILLELGFMTNIEERKKLVAEGYQKELAKSIAKGIVRYLEENE